MATSGPATLRELDAEAPPFVPVDLRRLKRS